MRGCAVVTATCAAPGSTGVAPVAAAAVVVAAATAVRAIVARQRWCRNSRRRSRSSGRCGGVSRLALLVVLVVGRAAAAYDVIAVATCTRALLRLQAATAPAALQQRQCLHSRANVGREVDASRRSRLLNLAKRHCGPRDAAGVRGRSGGGRGCKRRGEGALRSGGVAATAAAAAA